MNHELKIWPQYYAAVADGSKTFEARNNDRGFQKGDEVALRCWSPEHCCFIEPYAAIRFKVGYVLPIDGGKVVFSLLPLTAAEVADADE